MAKTISGRCKCGQIAYSGELVDAPMFRCYCRDCQQLTGAGHSEMVPLAAGSFSSKGTIREFAMTGGSGRPTWSGFCPNCGSPLTRRSERMNDRVYIHAASMDDPSDYNPTLAICREGAQHWDTPTD